MDESWELAADGGFIRIGFDPNNPLVPLGVKVNCHGYVGTGEKCETIFSAGLPSVIYGRNTAGRLYFQRDWCLSRRSHTFRVAKREY